MIQTVTKSYHDYVIKDGQFIGDFENMYKNCEDPWTQATQPNKYARNAGIWHLKNFGINSVLECGSGLGYYAKWIHEETGIVPTSVDISVEAIKRAEQLFPELNFEVTDITQTLARYANHDCILFAEIIWYILPNLNDLFEVMRTHFKGKHLMVIQVFYKGSQKYGTEYFTSLKEFQEYVPFEVVASCEATRAEDNTIETATLFKID